MLFRSLVGDSRKNKPGLFLPGDDFYGKAKRSFRARQDVVDVARDAKSVGCYGAYTIRMEVGQPFAKALQDSDSAFNGLFIDDFFKIGRASCRESVCQYV